MAWHWEHKSWPFKGCFLLSDSDGEIIDEDDEKRRAEEGGIIGKQWLQKRKIREKTSQFLVKFLADEQRLFFVGSILSIHSWVTRLISEQADLHLQYFNLDLPKVLLKRPYSEKENRWIQMVSSLKKKPYLFFASECKIYYSVDVNQQTSILIDVPIKKEQQIWARDPKPLRKRHKRDNEKVFCGSLEVLSTTLRCT